MHFQLGWLLVGCSLNLCSIHSPSTSWKKDKFSLRSFVCWLVSLLPDWRSCLATGGSLLRLYILNVWVTAKGTPTVFGLFPYPISLSLLEIHPTFPLPSNLHFTVILIAILTPPIPLHIPQHTNPLSPSIILSHNVPSFHLPSTTTPFFLPSESQASLFVPSFCLASLDLWNAAWVSFILWLIFNYECIHTVHIHLQLGTSLRMIFSRTIYPWKI